MSDKTVQITINPNQGYAADQVVDTYTMTLGDLLNLVQDAIVNHGEDAKIVTRDEGNWRGARWGTLSAYEEIVEVEADDEDY